MQKFIRSITVLLTFFTSPGVFALGLGNAGVQSYLGQTLDVRVELISNSQEELNSVTAGLASASTMEVLGISRTVSIPLRFEVHAELDNAYIQITSRLPVSDPVIQVVVEARWAGGRLVREYTFFLDPPTVPSRAPAPLIINRARVGEVTAEEQMPEIYPLPDKSKVAQKTLTEPVIEPVATPAQTTADRPITEPQSTAQVSEEDIASARNEPRQTATVPAEPVFEAVPKEALTSGTEPDEADEPLAAPGEFTGQPAKTLGPVQSGQTLWSIASDHARSTPYSINQAMLAIQRLNPDAFGNNNINLLKRGAILRMPGPDEMGRISARQAMVESIRQVAAYKAEKASLPFDSQAPAYANNTIDADAPGEDEPNSQVTHLAQQEVAEPPEESLLQLVPPADESDPGNSGTGSALQPTGAVASEDLQEVLARTEEELANAKQENAYLNERIRELEARVADSGGEITVTDGELAELESRLKEERLSEEPGQIPAAKQAVNEEEWYSGKTWWLAGLFLLVIAVVVWLLKRLGGGGEGTGVSPVPRGDRSTVTEIRSEAEDLLKSLDSLDVNSSSDTETGTTAGTGNVIDLERYGDSSQNPQPLEAHPDPEQDPEPEPEPVSEPEALPPKPKATPVSDEAIELDGDDPETMLDLARAYISMSDSEAARKILEEVIEVGDELQVAEARGMMQEL